MLSIIICAAYEGFTDSMLDYVTANCHRQGSECRLVVRSEEPSEVMAFLKDVRGPCLGVVQSSENARDKLKSKVLLARAITNHNVESLLLLLISDLRMLELFVNQGTRPAGMLFIPPDPERFRKLMDRLLSARAWLPDAGEQMLTVSYGHTTYRLPHMQVLYLEAQEKRVVIHTTLQCFTVYQSLRSLANQLGDAFMQCHRAYWVNTRAVRSADYPRMLLTLTNGEQLPISRSARPRVESVFSAAQGG